MSEEDFGDILKTVMKASLMVFFFMLVSRVFGYGSNIAIAKYFSEDIYGAYALLWSTVTLTTSILLVGLPWGASRFIAYYRGRKEADAVADTFKTSLIATLTLIIVFAVVMYGLLNATQDFFSVDAKAVSSTVVLFAGFAFFTYFFQAIIGFRKPEVANITESIAKVFAFAGILFLIYRGTDLGGILLVLALAYAVAGFTGLGYCIKNYGMAGRFKPEILKKIVRFGSSIMVINLTYGILTWADVFMLRAFQNLSSVGVYYAANLLSTAGLMLFGTVAMVFTPTITEYYGQNRIDKMSRLSSYLLETFFVLFTPVFLVFLVFPKELLVTFFRPEYVVAALALQLMVVSQFLYGLVHIFRGILQAVGKPQLEVKIVVAAAIVNVVLNLLLIKPYGIVGAALATVVGNGVIFVASYSYARKIVKLDYSKKRVIKVVTACILALYAASILKTSISDPLQSLITAGVALVIVYGMVLLVLRSFRQEDVFAVTAILQKMAVPVGLRKGIVAAMQRGVPR